MELGGGSSNKIKGKASEGNIMEQFPVTALPEDIQASVAECVATNSVADRYRLRSTCKSMKELIDLAGIYAALDGVHVFYMFDLQDEGLALIKRAADAGFECALYTYAMTLKVFWDNEEHFSGFTRESFERIGKIVRSLEWGCGKSHAVAFLVKTYEFISKVMPFSIIANVLHGWSEIGIFGTLRTIRVKICVTGAFGSKS
ncbi:hypothetical protein F2Q69_00035396 [Brassica cretica]|uniref:F-box domain-containing protein n=1 Tax=Brassica cretica TaxID=69181 RepID=A0A8S9SNR8_BRACR|nr:hypothetical protein F2Q69_00035396 [Brassica cretica]